MNKKLVSSMVLILILAFITFVLVNKNYLKNDVLPSNATFVSTLKTSDGKILGDVYVTYINKDIFSSLYIVKDVNGNKNIIYKINNNGFFNTRSNKTEILVAPNIYGWKLFVAKESIEVNIVGSNGKDISDNVTVLWDKDMGIFKVLKF